MAPALDSKRLFDCKDYSDVTIKIDDRELKCHKLVLCDSSEYFKTLCGEGSQFRESGQSVIELKDDGPKAAEAVIRHLYKFDYTEIKQALGGFDALNHVHTALAADKYLMADLEKTALKGLKAELKRIEFECEDQGDARAIFHLLQLLSHYTERHATIRNLTTRMTKTHLADLFKLKEFRASLETDEASSTLELCMRTFEHGHKHPVIPDGLKNVVERRFCRCVDCDTLWANEKLSACPGCGNKKVERMAIERLGYIKRAHQCVHQR